MWERDVAMLRLYFWVEFCHNVALLHFYGFFCVINEIKNHHPPSMTLLYPINLIPLISGFLNVFWLIFPLAAFSQTSPGNDLDISPEIRENSPVLRRWLQKVPNILHEIKNEPSFRTRIRVGYSLFPANQNRSGVNVGIEDVLIPNTPIAVRGEYETSFDGQRQRYGADLQYYLRPLGSYVNVAPVFGYRHVQTNRDDTHGVNIGGKLLFSLSRGGGADITLTQTWVAPGSREEVGLTGLSLGYAIAKNLRISTDIQQQNTRRSKDSRVGLVLEWMP